MKNTSILVWRAAAVFAAAIWVAGCDDSSSGGGAGGSGAAGGMGGSGAMGGGGAGGQGGGGAGGEGGQPPGEECLTDTECPDNQYCNLPQDALVGECTIGCRQEPDNCTGGQECNPDHQCITPPCESNDDCADGQICREDGTCGDVDCIEDADCGFSQDGRAQRCNPESNTCEPLQVCCSADNACSLTVAGACDGTALANAISCDTEPCGAQCASDAECDADRFCNADGRCEIGCRVGPPDNCPNPGEICDPGKHTCEDQPCAEDLDCPAGMYCDTGAGVCRDGCSPDRPADCPDGMCSEEARICVGVACDPNAPDACEPDEYCDDSLRACRPRCDAHEVCGALEGCDFATGQCEEGLCRDDVFPQGTPRNDSRENAVDIELQAQNEGVRTGAVQGRILCDGAPDFYGFHLNVGERVQVQLSFMQADGNLDLFLYNANGDELASAATLGAPEVIEFPEIGQELPAADYFIEVRGAAGITFVRYDLRLTAVDPRGAEGACFPDEREFGGGDDVRDRATEVAVGQGVNFNGTVCRDDQDWFRWDADIGDGLDVALVTTVDSDTLVVELYAGSTLQAGGGLNNPDIVAAAERRGDGTTAHTVQLAPKSFNFADENWFLRVRGDDGASLGRYSLTIRVTRDPERCMDDASEPDNAVGEATDLAGLQGLGMGGRLVTGRDLEVPLDLTLCPNDEDFFCLDAQANDQLQAWVEGADDFIGQATLEFTDARGVERGRPGALDGDRATLALAADERVCLRIDGVGLASGAYTLFVRSDVAAEGCGIDVAETAPGAERNDESTDATELMSIAAGAERYQFSNGYVCNADGPDRDWYRFDVANDDSRICVSVDFAGENGDLDVDLYRDFGQGEACQVSAQCAQPGAGGIPPGGQCINGRCQPALNEASSDFAPEILDRPKSDGVPAGDYWVRVHSDREQENAYDLTVTVTPNGACGADWRERDEANDGIVTATFLGGGNRRLCDAWLCQAGPDDDWYAIDVDAGEDKTVAITFQALVDGSAVLEVHDEATGRLGRSSFAQINGQCLNLRGGDSLRRLYVRVRNTNDFLEDGEPFGDARLDYQLHVVRTDLDASPGGRCSQVIDAQQEWPAIDL